MGVVEDYVSFDRETKNRLTRCMRIKSKPFDLILKIFNEKIKPDLAKNYLSHLKSSIEDMINKGIREEILKNLEKNLKTSEQPNAENTINQLKLMAKHNAWRPFSITLKPTQSSKIDAYIDFHDFGAMIYYYEKLTDRQLRLHLAHEIGHIFVYHILGNGKLTEEEVETHASLFGLIAMADKDNFYNKHAKGYTSTTQQKLVADYLQLYHYDRE